MVRCSALLLALAFAGPTRPTIGPSAKRLAAIAKANEGVRLATHRDREGAIASLTEAVALDPSWGHAHVSLGRLYREAKVLGDSESILREGLDASPSDPEIRRALTFELGVTLVHKGAAPSIEPGLRAPELASARALLDVAADGGDYRALHWRGRAFAAAGKSDEADADYRQCLKLRPRAAACYLGLADLYAELGAREVALEVLDIAAEHIPPLPGILEARGRLLLDLTRAKEAVESFRRATHVDPESTAAWYGLGMAYFEVRVRERAKESMQKFLDLAATAPDVPPYQAQAARDALAYLEDVI